MHINWNKINITDNLKRGLKLRRAHAVNWERTYRGFLLARRSRDEKEKKKYPRISFSSVSRWPRLRRSTGIGGINRSRTITGSAGVIAKHMCARCEFTPRSCSCDPRLDRRRFSEYRRSPREISHLPLPRETNFSIKSLFTLANEPRRLLRCSNCV